MENVDKRGLVYIPGVEISCEKNDYKMHILGYNIDVNNTELVQLLQNMKMRKNLRNLEIIQQLKEKFGIIISKDETEKLLTAKNFVGQTTIARLLTKRGIIPNTQYAFDNYFKYMDLKTPATAPLEQAINTIHLAGGYAVLAHPISLEKTYGVNIEDIFGMFKNAGFDKNKIHSVELNLLDGQVELILRALELYGYNLEYMLNSNDATDEQKQEKISMLKYTYEQVLASQAEQVDTKANNIDNLSSLGKLLSNNFVQTQQKNNLKAI